MIGELVALALMIGVLIALRTPPPSGKNDDDDDGPGQLRRIRVPVEACGGPRNFRR